MQLQHISSKEKNHFYSMALKAPEIQLQIQPKSCPEQRYQGRVLLSFHPTPTPESIVCLLVILSHSNEGIKNGKQTYTTKYRQETVQTVFLTS